MANGKKKKAADAVPPKQQLIDDGPLVDKVESVFLLENITLKKDGALRMKVTLKKMLPQTYREYTARLSCNEAPFLRKIENLENELQRVGEETSLFADVKKSQVEDIKQEIQNVEEDMQRQIENTPVVEFEATIESLAYKDGDTIVTMIFPSNIVEALNKARLIFHLYKIELIR